MWAYILPYVSLLLEQQTKSKSSFGTSSYPSKCGPPVAAGDENSVLRALRRGSIVFSSVPVAQSAMPANLQGRMDDFESAAPPICKTSAISLLCSKHHLIRSSRLALRVSSRVPWFQPPALGSISRSSVSVSWSTVTKTGATCNLKC